MSTFAIVGGSYAAVQAAISARQHGYEGRIIMFSAEQELPYHRPPLSKVFLSTDVPISNLWLRSESFYDEHQIELALGEVVQQISIPEKKITVGSTTLNYDQLLLATGANAIQLPGQPSVKGVYTLRNLKDAEALKEHMQTAQRAVVIGGGFIGLEVASSLVKSGIHTTVVEQSSRLVSRVLSPLLSNYIRAEHEKKGVEFCLNAQVTGLKHDRQVQAVLLQDGRELAADIVIVGIGAKPNTSLLDAMKDTQRGIQVSPEAKTVIPSILAAGDCARLELRLGSRSQWLCLESVNAANELGKAAGASIVGKSVPYNTAPWFWSDQFDLKVQMVGIALPDDQLILRGTLNSNRFSVFHLRATGEIGAVQSINRPAEHMLARRLVNEKALIAPYLLEDESISLKDCLNQIISDSHKH